MQIFLLILTLSFALLNSISLFLYKRQFVSKKRVLVTIDWKAKKVFVVDRKFKAVYFTETSYGDESSFTDISIDVPQIKHED